LRVSFELDATSVGDLIERYAGAPGRDVRAHRDTLLAYLDARFTVAADDRPRAREAAASITESGGRVHVSGSWRCAGPPDVLALESTLFLDEETPHRVLGTLRHGRALERYLFGRSERTARIELAA